MSMILNPYASFPVVSTPGISWANVRGLWHFDNNLTDSKTGTSLTDGGVTYVSGKFSQAKKGAANTGLGNNNLDIPSGTTFCVEGFINISDITGGGVFFRLDGAGAVPLLGLKASALGTVNQVIATVANVTHTVNHFFNTFYNGTYQYFALYRNSSNEVRCVMGATDTLVATISDPLPGVILYFPSGTYINGLDEVRVSVGANYTPVAPSSPFPNS